MTDFSKITALYHINRPCGFTLEELEPVRSIFGAIPQALVDYYAELGKYEFNQNQDSLSIPKEYQKGRPQYQRKSSDGLPASTGLCVQSNS